MMPLVSCLANIWSEREDLSLANAAFLERKAERDPSAGSASRQALIKPSQATKPSTTAAAEELRCDFTLFDADVTKGMQLRNKPRAKLPVETI